MNGLTKISIWKDAGVSGVSGEFLVKREGLANYPANYFLPEQLQESPHEDDESFRAGLKEDMRDHPRRAT